MRESDINKQMFHTGHYNVIAKQFREAFSVWEDRDDPTTLHAWSALVDLMLNMALRFQADNERFDPERFLAACSPDPNKYPFSDLWEKVMGKAVSHDGNV